MNREEFEKINVFGMGEPNVNFAKYFIGKRAAKSCVSSVRVMDLMSFKASS